VLLFGVNLGYVGFFVEIECEDISEIVYRVVVRDYVVEEWLIFDVVVCVGGEVIYCGWVLNEVIVEKVV